MKSSMSWFDSFVLTVMFVVLVTIFAVIAMILMACPALVKPFAIGLGITIGIGVFKLLSK